MIDKNNKLILAAIGKSLFGKSLREDINDEILSSIEWVDVVHESILQSVPAITLDGISEIKEYIPPNIYMRWMQHTFQVLNKNEILNNEQNILIDLLNNSGVPYIILKGSTAAYNYPNPSLRNMGDIDFLIKLDDKERVRKLLVNNDYIQNSEELAHHVTFEKNSVHIEMHIEITGIPYGRPGRIIRDYIKDIIDSSETVCLENNFFNIAHVKIQGIIFLLHTLRHLLKVGIGLRHLCDWAMFVNKQLNDEIWNEYYYKILKDTGLLEFTYAITWTCVKYLGLPQVSWMKPADDEICEAIINDILKSGNFGRKDATRAFSGKVAFNSVEYDKKTSILSNIHNTIINTAHTHWPITKKIPVLLIFAYIYFPVRQLVFMIIGKRSKIDMKSLFLHIKERDKAYGKLNIFKTDDKDE